MLALTLKHPWPFAILRLGKRIENRAWRPPASLLRPGDWFALHGGAVPTGRDDLEEIADVARGLISDCRPPLGPGEDITLGDAIIPGIFAVCRLGPVFTSSPDYWFDGPFGWRLDDLVPLPEPVPCRGAQKLWSVPEAAVRTVREGFRRARVGLTPAPSPAAAPPPAPPG